MRLSDELVNVPWDYLFKFADIECHFLGDKFEFVHEWIFESGDHEFFGGSFGLFANSRHGDS